MSLHCTANKCVPASCSDTILNGTETDLNCGGTCPKCVVGKKCKLGADCAEGVCTPGALTCAAPTNADGAQNGNETDVDCGDGPAGTDTNAPLCIDGKKCAGNDDCVSLHCVGGLCVAPTCNDGIQNGTETDVDCGNDACPAKKCAPTKKCLTAVDCAEGVCTPGALTCAAPTGTDGVKNGNETDLDCGSSAVGLNSNAPACDAGLTCINNVDCKSTGCNQDKKCAFARSCTVAHGGTSCGTGDNASKDCCESADVPTYNLEGFNNTTAVRLDTYQITSGRIRRFLKAVNGNVQGWVVANRANINAPGQLPVALDKYLPTGWTQANDPADLCYPNGTAPTDPVVPCNYGALNQVSGYRYNNSPGGDNGYGCSMTAGGYGSRTYWLTAAESLATGEILHSVPTDRVEEKAMTCATYYILAAFCAWDGGRLATQAEYNAAYGGTATAGQGRIFPWGSDTTSRAIGFASIGSHVVSPTNGYTPPASGDPMISQFSVYNPMLNPAEKAALLLRINRANLSWNYASGMLFDYRAPLEDPARARMALAEASVNPANDQSMAVAPPGRYPAGEGRYGHRDLLGNVLEIQAQTGTATAGGNRPWGRNGSFETAHFNAATMLGYNGYAFSPLTKYGRAGGRCARPAGVYPTTPPPEAPPP